MLRGQGSSWAQRQPCPVSQLSSRRLAKSSSHTRGEAFRRAWTLWPSGRHETETTHCPRWSPTGCPGMEAQHGAGMIPACRRLLAPPCPLPASVQLCSSLLTMQTGKPSAGHGPGSAPAFLGVCSQTVQNQSRCRYTFSNNALNRCAFVFSARQQSTGWMQTLTVVLVSAEPPWLHLNVLQSDGRHQRTADLHV